MPLDDQARLAHLRAQPRTDRSFAERAARFLDALETRLRSLDAEAEVVRLADSVEGEDVPGLSVVGLTWVFHEAPAAMLDLHLLRLGDDPFASDRHRFGGGAAVVEGARSGAEALRTRLRRACPGVAWEPLGLDGVRGFRLDDPGGDPEGAFHALRQLGRAFPGAYRVAANAASAGENPAHGVTAAARAALGWEATWARWRAERGAP